MRLRWFVVLWVASWAALACNAPAPTPAPLPTPTPTPAPEIVGATARDGFPGFDYTIWVDCTVRNNGAAGNIEVVAELRAGGFWIKRDTVYVEKGQERKVTLAYPEPESLFSVLGGATFNCKATPK